MGSGPPSPVDRFVHTLMITGAWLLELVSGLTAELPSDRYPGEDPWAVVFAMLCGTIETALQAAEPSDVRLATELIDLAAARVEEHLRLACALSPRMHDSDDGDSRRTNG